MLRPIPDSLLTASAEFLVCTGTTQWQQPIWRRVTIPGVHLQTTNELRRGTQNAEVVHKAMLFINNSSGVDVYALMQESEDAGHAMECVVTGAYGGTYHYTVASVDALPDVPSTRIHHWEVELV